MSGADEFLLYTAPNGAVRVTVAVFNESVWLPQRALAELFGVKVPAISKHLKNIFEEGELQESAVVSILETTAPDGKARAERHFHLDAIMAVGYRVKSLEGTQFRIWATRLLCEYIAKGFVLDDARLARGQAFGKDHFDELLERIRAIRASERRFCQKMTELFTLSADYDEESPLARGFLASVRDKLYWAVTEQTEAEVIFSSADASRVNMGLTTWRHALAGRILKSDVTVAKNYLTEAHVSALNRLASTCLGVAEDRTLRGIVMRMEDWAAVVDGYLQMADYPILDDKARVTALEAKLKAEAEFEVFRKRQDAEYVSDFDREIRRIEGKEP